MKLELYGVLYAQALAKAASVRAEDRRAAFEQDGDAQDVACTVQILVLE